MLKLTTSPNPLPPSSSLSTFSWTPGPRVQTPINLFTHFPASFCNLVRIIGWGAQEPGWKVSEMLSGVHGTVLGVCFLLFPPHKGAKRCQGVQTSSIKPECFRLFAAQFVPIFRCFPVPQCGFTRRIWRRPSSECHLNPSNVYSTLFHVSQKSWKDVNLGYGDQEENSGANKGGLIQLKSAP